jgi:hypothetical protein
MPTRDEVKPHVIEKLLLTTHKPKATQESSNLANDLVMSPPLIRAMWHPYSNISKSYPEGIGVTQTDASNCKTVKDSIDVVFKRSNGKKG